MYVVVLSAFLWLLLRPLRPARWSYLRILTFIRAVSPPALLYAIRGTLHDPGRDEAGECLVSGDGGGVARDSVRRLPGGYAGFHSLRLFVAAVLPLTLIVFSLMALNRERSIFDIMAGLDPNAGAASDTAYILRFQLTAMSFLAAPVVLLLYAVAVVLERQRPRAP